MKTAETFREGWYLIYTRPKNERKIFDQLNNNLEVFLPLRKELRQWTDRKKWVELPLFPSYVFVYLKDREGHHKALSADGACCFVSFGGKAALVPQKEINQIKFVLNNFKEVKLLNEKIEKGEKRKINSGPFKGYDCKVVKHNGKNKVIVEIESMRQNLIATISAASLHNRALG